MKKIFQIKLLVLLIFIICSASFKKDTFILKNKAFDHNETLDYNISYGIITAGTLSIQVGPSLHKINGRYCYKLNVYGSTTSAFDMITKIRNNWGAYIDTATTQPHMTFRQITEGNYKKYEIVRFDYQTEMAELKSFSFKRNEFNEPVYSQIPSNVWDIVGGNYYLRTLNYDSLTLGDTIRIPAFYENELFDFKILYAGKEKIKTKFGKINSIKLTPVMPDNKIFAGENSISLWISDDKNKIPLKAKASLFIGSAEVNIENYSGLKNEILFE